MSLKILNLQQGTGEWLNHRNNCLNASDAPAMRGESKYQTRSELIRQKATGIVQEHDAGTLARFQRGHDAEASIRPHVERIIGEPLYPVTGENEINGLRLSASSDGLTMAGDIGFEHKLWNTGLADSVSAGFVPDSHKWQIVHQHAVFGLEKTLFVVSDGTPELCVYCWVTVSDAEITELLAGWAMFQEDVANYNPANDVTAEVVEGRAPDTLPALFIEVTGKVTASNLAEFKETALSVFRGINTNLQTDQDFADAEKAVKFCKDAEDRLDAAKAHALGQTASIDELFRTIDQIKDEAKAVRLKLDKLVKAEKENRKAEIVTQARQEIENHIAALNKRIGGNWMPQASAAPFAEAIKGLKSLDSMRDKVSAALANAKVEASAIADTIEANQKSLNAQDRSWSFLFQDFAYVCTKPVDDFAALLSMRITNHNAAEEKRIEAERARIRSEEQAKAQKEQDARDAETARQRLLEQERVRLAVEQSTKAEAAAQQALAEQNALDALQHGFGPTAMTGIPVIEHSRHVENEPPLKLGEICSRLGFNVTAEFLGKLGFQPVGQERTAKLYAASSFPLICVALMTHIHSAMRAQMEAA